MSRPLEIITAVAEEACRILGIDLSMFTLVQSADQYSFWTLKNPILYRDQLEALLETRHLVDSIKSKLPKKLGNLIVIRESVSGGFIAIMPFKMICEMIIHLLPQAMLPFIVNNRQRLASSVFRFYSNCDSKLLGKTREGLAFKYYGWVCSSEYVARAFNNISIEMKTLLWAMYAGGYYSTHVRFEDSLEPADFMMTIPPAVDELKNCFIEWLKAEKKLAAWPALRVKDW